jgi:hypothetical protein
MPFVGASPKGGTAGYGPDPKFLAAQRSLGCLEENPTRGCRGLHRRLSHQPQGFEAGMSVLPNNNVIMHDYPQCLARTYDRLGHLNIGV